MLNLKIKKIPDSVIESITNYIEIDFKESQFSFKLEYNGKIVIGESQQKLSEQEILDIADQIIRRNNPLAYHDTGILSLVIIDSRAKNIMITNSLSGSASLYYIISNESLFISTHLIGLKSLGVKFELNEQVIPEMLVYRYVTTPFTLAKNVFKITPGSLLVFDLLNFELADNIIWTPQENSSTNDNETDIINQADQLLDSTISKQIKSSKKPGILFSGGLDSSLVASIANKHHKNIQSHSGSFQFLNSDDRESSYAISAAEHIKLEHTVHNSTTVDFLKGIIEAIYHAEEPIHHIQSVLIYLLIKNSASNSYDILFSGESADGLAGNDLHQTAYKNRNFLKFISLSKINALLLRPLVQGLETDHYRAKLFLTDYGNNINRPDHILWTVGQFADSSLVQDYMKCDFDQIINNRKDLIDNYSNNSLLNKISLLAYLCEGSYTMTVWNNLAKSSNIQMIYPFASPGFVNKMLSLPWKIKCKEPKYIIRSLLRNYQFPEEYINREKISFGLPMKFWSVPNSLFQTFVDMASEEFDPKFLKLLQVEKQDKAMLLWNIINLYIWKKIFIDNISLPEITEEFLSKYASQNKY